jgi:hypothetical protein
MNDRKQRDGSRHGAIEREIRADRKFSLAEAIGRAADGGHLQGASPVTLLEQAQTTAMQFAERQLDDPDGALLTLLARTVRSSEPIMARHLDQPLAGLVAVIEKLLGREEWLVDFVRDVDAEWGRRYQEPPHFEQPDQPTDPLDPYTLASVRTALQQLLADARRVTPG